MKLGDIFVWDTDQAKGHDLRRKYHVYLSEGNWRTEGHAFLFVSSADYGGDYAISNTDYKFFPNETSYIGCGGMVFYDDEALAVAKPKLMGKLSKEHMIELYKKVLDSEFMVGWQIKMACEALKAAF